jgi:DNA protecting protein DprA
MLTDITRKLFTLQKLEGIGKAALEQLSSLEGFATSSLDDLARENKRLLKALGDNDTAWNIAVEKAELDIETAEKLDTRILCILDDDYPALLKDTGDKHNPFFLYVKGHFAQQPSKSIAIIGTRQPTKHGKIITERVTEFFVTEGWSIVSGLAIGCDVISHEVTLARGGHAVAVLAHGLHTIAPKQHTKIADQILEKGGVLITEYGFGVDALPFQFVKRDRIQAGLAKGVVMIQSDLDGGSLHASRASIEYKRILAVPQATALDIENKEEKVKANQILCGHMLDDKLKLLKCDEPDLNNIFILHGRNDYANLAQRLLID